jgi:hypothetical protein
MRRLIATALLLWTVPALAREPSKKFQGWYHGYFEQYAAADVPQDAADYILVIGHVKKPGIIPPRDGLTLLQALAEAGGLTDWGDHHRVGVWKEKDGCFVITNARQIERKEATDPLLQKGDMVIVSGRWMLGIEP